ncbi:MAG: polysaccharide biosynthesis/export family protein [Myxococcales bacterium]
MTFANFKTRPTFTTEVDQSAVGGVGRAPAARAKARTHERRDTRRPDSALFQRMGRCCSLLVFVATGVVGCRSSGAFVWVQEAPDRLFKTAPILAISPGDIISVRVFGQDPVSVKTSVRADGAIAMPLLGDVVVAGKAPSAVAKELEAKLVPYFTTPNVVVVVEESRVRIVAIGEVNRNGTVVLDAGETGILSALANAGGLTQYAGNNDIYVLRQDERGTVRIRFSYDDIVRGVGKAANFRLQNGDQLVVE